METYVRNLVLRLRMPRPPSAAPLPAMAHAPECTIARALPAKEARAGHRGSLGHPYGLPRQRGGATGPKLNWVSPAPRAACACTTGAPHRAAIPVCTVLIR